MAVKKKQENMEGSSRKLRSEAEKKVARSSDKSAELKKQDLDKLVHELQVHQVELEMQNEELRTAQMQLEKSREDYVDLYDFAPVGYFTFSSQALIIEVNLTGAALLGVERTKLLKRRFRQFVAPADAERWDRHFVNVLQQGEKQSCDLLLKHKDGSTLYARLDSIRVEMDDGTGVVRTAMSDMTAEKQAEEQANAALEKYRVLFESFPLGISITDKAGNLVETNKESERLLGLTRDGHLQRKYDGPEWRIIRPDGTLMPPDEYASVRALRENRRIENVEMGIVKGGNEITWINVTAEPVPLENFGVAITYSDITERTAKKLEYQTILRTALDGFWLTDMQGHFLDVNQSYCRLTGYSYDELMNMAIKDIEGIEQPEHVAKRIHKIKEVGHDRFETRHRRKDGGLLDIEVSVNYLPIDNGRLFVFCRDITERKLAEETILRSKLLLVSVIDSTPDWMYVKDMHHRFLLVNKSFAEAQNLAPQDMIGRADTDFFSEELCLGNPDKGITGFHADDNQAFRGQMVHNPRNIVTWADGLMHIYDTYKIPLADQSGKIYAALVYSRDMTTQRKAEDELEASFNALQKTLHDVINTVTKIVEMRDPYTSGHQGRVADLSGAIAREIKLDDTRIEHLMMAASIHDVGKMYVPADILSKPGRLSEIEWAMIKTHVEGSYEILKDLEFSQPIALMALQHHERLDGSGYPNGLKGEETLLEAKILAVADVVEAMSSHRPYRPALGIDKALEEISSNKGVLYDPDIVDTCLKLFKNGQFKFKPV